MYGKIFESMYDGSMYGRWEAIVTLQQMIVLAEKDGTLDMTPEALSARTSIPLAIIQAGLSELEQPDGKSRTPTADGRRIVRLNAQREWGWRIVNYRKYRAIRTAEERREYMRKYQRVRRAKLKEASVDGKQASTKTTNSSKQYAGSSKQEAEKISRPAVASRKTTWLTPYWDAWTTQYGGKPNAGMLSKNLKPLHDQHGLEETLRRWMYYLSQTPAEYASPPRFASTWGRWVDGAEPQSELGFADQDFDRAPSP